MYYTYIQYFNIYLYRNICFGENNYYALVFLAN